MRPVCKGNPYKYTNGSPYASAVNGLAARLGRYCSYCERAVQTGLEVEHIQPKAIPANQHLECNWANFLLSCRNCNATKSNKNPPLSDWLIPDRDSTAAAFFYRQDGVIGTNPGLTALQTEAAEKTLTMMGLNKKVRRTLDEKGTLVALDRRNQRMEARLLADRWMSKWVANPSADIADAIEDLARSNGFFSIWLEAFSSVPPIRWRLINAFPGTEVSCFDPVTTLPTSPHPNYDGLQAGSKL